MLSHDVLIIGGGGAGLRAAMAVLDLDPKLSVAVVSKVYPMRSHTVAAEGGAAAVARDNDSFDAHAYDTISGADWLADQDAVEMFVKEAPRELLQLEHWGCPWSRDPDGRVAVRPFGGMKNERTWFAADKTGFHLLHTLFQTSLKYDTLVRYDEWFATKLLVHDGRCVGVTAIELRTGQLRCLTAPAVILATGGAGRMFPFTTNGAIKTGDGMALAYRAGVPLKDLEFVQYHPTGLPGTGILITEAARGEGGIMVNKHGDRYLRHYDLGEPLDINDPKHPQKRTMELGPRDRLSQAFVHEMAKGNTIHSPFGEVVHLDIRHLGKKKINRKLPFVRELSLNYAGIDPVYEPIPVRPVVHYMMGGVHTNARAETPMPGLFAAGECACVSINGANRLGSNSLTELFVFGKMAGHSAVEYVRSNAQGPMPRAHVEAMFEDERDRLRTELLQRPKSDAGHRIADLRNRMYETMESGAGIYREAAGLRATCSTLATIKELARHIELDDRSNSYNTELLTALELQNMIEIAEALAHSALQRTESRGSHQRTDHPERNDQQFLRHSMAYRTDGAPGTPRIEYHDVVITKWPPGMRVYGEATNEKEAAVR
jgi:fumarate reductase flavoprotein subunit